MVFSSLLFLFGFLPLVLSIYYLLPQKYRNAFLFFSSLFFYAWGEPVYIVIMLVSTVFDYFNGLMLGHFEGQKRKQQAVVVLAVVGNLAILGFFKYADFFIANVNAVLGLNLNMLNIPLPIGVSFYTFQTMSYSIDVYRKEAPIQRDILSFGAYVVLFPQLIAGPIVRYKDVADALNYRIENLKLFSDGVERFCVGLVKKVLLANNIGLLWDKVKVLPAADHSVLAAWLGILAFAFQIYFDFSGYSDMAIGLGRMLGFDFPENFNFPYISKSVTEFWRRWHISLGTWFREYVYIPLGGNRASPYRHIFNIFTVWFLTGLWHGASWNYVLWGLYYFVLLIAEKYFLGSILKKAPAFFSVSLTFFFTLIGWVIFAIEDLSFMQQYLAMLFGFNNTPFVSQEGLYLLTTYLPQIAISILASTPVFAFLHRKIKDQNPLWLPLATGASLALAFFLSTAYLVDSTYNPFLYFRF